jgi:hypothetical protein
MLSFVFHHKNLQLDVTIPLGTAVQCIHFKIMCIKKGMPYLNLLLRESSLFHVWIVIIQILSFLCQSAFLPITDHLKIVCAALKHCSHPAVTWESHFFHHPFILSLLSGKTIIPILCHYGQGKSTLFYFTFTPLSFHQMPLSGYLEEERTFWEGKNMVGASV